MNENRIKTKFDEFIHYNKNSKVPSKPPHHTSQEFEEYAAIYLCKLIQIQFHKKTYDNVLNTIVEQNNQLRNEIGLIQHPSAPNYLNNGNNNNDEKETRFEEKQNERFKAGDLCKLNGLKTTAHMNGKLCKIIGPFDIKEERFPVLVCEVNDIVAIKPLNLILMNKKGISLNTSMIDCKVRTDGLPNGANAPKDMKDKNGPAKSDMGLDQPQRQRNLKKSKRRRRRRRQRKQSRKDKILSRKDKKDKEEPKKSSKKVLQKDKTKSKCKSINSKTDASTKTQSETKVTFKSSKGRKILHLRQQNTNDVITISVNSTRNLIRTIKRQLKIAAELRIKLIKGGIGNWEWNWESQQQKPLMLLFQTSNSENLIKIFVSENMMIHKLQEILSKKVKYQFQHNGNILYMTDCIKDYDICDGDIILCEVDNTKGLDSITVDNIITIWFGNKSNLNVNIWIKKYVLIFNINIADSFGIPIYIICDTKTCIDKLAEFESYKSDFVGFDCELVRGKNKVVLIQIANKHMILLIRLHLLSEIPDKLRTFCMNKNIKKCGVAIRNDKSALRRHNIILNECIDLCRLRYAPNKKCKSLAKLSEVILQQPMLFKQLVNHWRWKSKQLDHIQISYASDDAIVGYLLYQHFMRKK